MGQIEINNRENLYLPKTGLMLRSPPSKPKIVEPWRALPDPSQLAAHAGKYVRIRLPTFLTDVISERGHHHFYSRTDSWFSIHLLH